MASCPLLPGASPWGPTLYMCLRGTPPFLKPPLASLPGRASFDSLFSLATPLWDPFTPYPVNVGAPCLVLGISLDLSFPPPPLPEDLPHPRLPPSPVLKVQECLAPAQSSLLPCSPMDPPADVYSTSDSAFPNRPSRPLPPCGSPSIQKPVRYGTLS